MFHTDTCKKMRPPMGRGVVEYEYDPIGSCTRAVVITIGCLTVLLLVGQMVASIIYANGVSDDIHKMKSDIKLLKSGAEQLLDNSGACMGEDCAMYGTMCAAISDCPNPVVKADVTVTKGCHFGVCVWLFDPANFVGAMPPLGPYADKLCKQVIVEEDIAASSCLTSIAVPDGDGVDGCIAFNGCFVTPAEAFMIVVRGMGQPHPDTQSRLRSDANLPAPGDSLKVAGDASLSVEARREMLRNNRRVL